MRSQQTSAARDACLRLSVVDSLEYSRWLDLALVDRAQGDYRGALKASARAFVIDTGALTRDNLNNEYGAIFVALGLPDSAERVFRLMLTGSPAQRAGGYQSLAFTDAHLGVYTPATAHIDSAIVRDSAHTDTSNAA